MAESKRKSYGKLQRPGVAKANPSPTSVWSEDNLIAVCSSLASMLDNDSLLDLMNFVEKEARRRRLISDAQNERTMNVGSFVSWINDAEKSVQGTILGFNDAAAFVRDQDGRELFVSTSRLSTVAKTISGIVKRSEAKKKF